MYRVLHALHIVQMHLVYINIRLIFCFLFKFLINLYLFSGALENDNLLVTFLLFEQSGKLAVQVLNLIFKNIGLNCKYILFMIVFLLFISWERFLFFLYFSILKLLVHNKLLENSNSLFFSVHFNYILDFLGLKYDIRIILKTYNNNVINYLIF